MTKRIADMTPQEREDRREYMRKWREAHREQINAYQREYRRVNRGQTAASAAKYWQRIADEYKYKDTKPKADE